MGWLLLLCAATAGCSSLSGGQKSGFTSDSRLRVAEAAEQSGDKDMAASQYAAAAQAAPDDTATQIAAAGGLARNGKWVAARDLLTARLKTHPKDTELLRGLASLHLLAGQFGPAIARLDQALAVAPADTNALVDKAVALDLQHRHAEAQRLYRRALAIVPDDPVISNDLAVSLMIEGRTREAQEVLAPFADSDSAPERLRNNLGILYSANGDSEQSNRMLEGRLGAADLSVLTQAIRAGTALP
jgi:tetratricopeptide (TPR) repeat protein